MISDTLSKKGYKLFRRVPFIDREDEREFFKEYFQEEPQKLLFVYGPKSTGKTTLIEYIIENELIDNRTLFKSSRYNIKYLNLRRKLIGSYDTFLDSITTIENSKLQEKLSAELNLGIFRLNSEIFEAIKEKEIDIFEALINEFKKSKKRNVFIIDEIQTLEDIYINGSRELLKEFLNFCVRLTKELHLSHVVILTSNTIFLNRIYNDAKLKATSIFKFIDHPKEDIATKLLVDLGYNKEQTDLVIDYYGTAFTYLLKVAQFVKPNENIDILKEYLEKERLDAYMQIKDLLIRKRKYNLPQNASSVFKSLAKEIIKDGHYNLDKKDEDTLEDIYLVMEIFCQKEILFFEPQTGLITPNSRIYLKAMIKILD